MYSFPLLQFLLPPFSSRIAFFSLYHRSVFFSLFELYRTRNRTKVLNRSEKNVKKIGSNQIESTFQEIEKERVKKEKK